MKTKVIFGVIAALALSPGVIARVGQSHYSLVKGNKLYANCQSYERNVTFGNAGNFLVCGSVEQKVQAKECLSYIEGVVDSLSAGKDFHPSEDVKASQYVDVVFNYLTRRSRNQTGMQYHA